MDGQGGRGEGGRGEIVHGGGSRTALFCTREMAARHTLGNSVPVRLLPFALLGSILKKGKGRGIGSTNRRPLTVGFSSKKFLGLGSTLVTYVLKEMSPTFFFLHGFSFWMFFSMPIGLEERESDHSFTMFHLPSLPSLPFLSLEERRGKGDIQEQEKLLERDWGKSLTILVKSKQVCTFVHHSTMIAQ